MEKMIDDKLTEEQIKAIWKRGLSHNLGQSNLKDKLYLNRNLGKKVK